VGKNNRIIESRNKISNAFSIALGSYIEQEAKKEDSWRDLPFSNVYSHLLHEVEEIKRSKDKTILLHNLIDLCALSAILIAKLMETDK